MKREVLARMRSRFRLHRDMGRAMALRHGAPGIRGVAALLACLMLAASPAPAPTAPAATGGPVRLVAFGDSLTAGYRLPEAQAFPAVLERMLKAKGYDVSVANAGVSGDTSTGGADRVDWSVPEGTDGVILELGANDMLRGTDPAVTEKALSAILDRLRERHVPVLLAGMLAAPNLGPAYKGRFDAIYPDLARRYGLPLYPFFLDGIMGDPAQHLDDGLHPNARGVETVAARILPAVEAFVTDIRPGAAR